MTKIANNETRWIFWEVDGASGSTPVQVEYLHMELERLERAGYVILSIERSY